MLCVLCVVTMFSIFLIDRSKALQVSIENIQSKEPKVERLVAKCEADTEKCVDELAEVKKSMQELEASGEKAVSEFIVNCLSQNILASKSFGFIKYWPRYSI